MELGLVLRWLVLYAVLFAAALPTARLLFPGAPDDGAGFALPVAVVVVTLTAFWVGHVTFGPWTALASVCVLVALGLAANARSELGLRSLANRRVAASFGAFLVGFAVLLAFRASDPGITPAGGEHFLHVGIYQSTLRAGSLPPADVWYAGDSVRYYFGLPTFNSVAALLTATTPRHAFNLALAGYFGALVAAAFSLGRWLTRDLGRSGPAGGALAAFFVAFAGNAATPVRLLWDELPRGLAVEYGRPVFGAIRHIEYPQAIFEQGAVTEWSWFYDRYVVPGTLQEFPLYSFVKADMHGHTATTSVLVLAAALGYALYLTPAAARRRRLLLVLVAMPLVGGYFGVANTWSIPTVAGIAWLALALGGPHPATVFPARVADRLRPDGRWPIDGAWRAALAAGWAAVVGALSAAVAAPFLLSHTPRNEGVGFLPPRTGAAGLLLVYGGLFALFGLYLATRLAPLDDRRPRDLAVAGLGIAAVLAVAWAVGDLAAFVLVAPPIAVGGLLVRTERDVGYETVLLVAGLGLVLSMELVYAKVVPFDIPRWNTTLKVAVQAWVLAGVAAGPIAARLVGEAGDRLRDGPGGGGVASGPTLPSLAAVVLVVAVVASSATFGVLTAGSVVGGAVVDDREFHLDGYATHERWRGDEMAAIAWLDGNASGRQSVLWMERRVGTATVAEAPAEETYTWKNPASTLTGLQSVVGWSHEEIHRGESAFDDRVRDLEILFTGDDPSRAAILRKYGVDYVYVGPVERERYGDELADLREDPALVRVFENDAVTIYAVELEADGNG